MKLVTVSGTLLSKMKRAGKNRCINPKCKRKFKVGDKVWRIGMRLHMSGLSYKCEGCSGEY